MTDPYEHGGATYRERLDALAPDPEAGPLSLAVERESFQNPKAIALANEGAQVHAAVAAIAQFPISGQADLDAVARAKLEARERRMYLEEQCKLENKPDLDRVEQRRSWYRPAREAYEALERACSARVERHMADQRAAQQAAQEAAGAAFQAGDSVTAQAALATVAPTLRPAGLTIRTVLDYEITNPDAVPRELCSPDPKKIKAALAIAGPAGIIPGVHIFEKQIAQKKAQRNG